MVPNNDQIHRKCVKYLMYTWLVNNQVNVHKSEGLFREEQRWAAETSMFRGVKHRAPGRVPCSVDPSASSTD